MILFMAHLLYVFTLFNANLLQSKYNQVSEN